MGRVSTVVVSCGEGTGLWVARELCDVLSVIRQALSPALLHGAGPAYRV